MYNTGLLNDLETVMGDSLLLVTNDQVVATQQPLAERLKPVIQTNDANQIFPREESWNNDESVGNGAKSHE